MALRAIRSLLLSPCVASPQGVGVLQAMLRPVTCDKVSGHIAAEAFVSQGLDRYDLLRCALELQGFLPMGKALRNRVHHAVPAAIFDTGQETFLDEFLMRRLEDRLHLRGVRIFGQRELPLKLK